MSIATVVTRGYGSFGTVNFIPTLGYSISTAEKWTTQTPDNTVYSTQPVDSTSYTKQNEDATVWTIQPEDS